MIIPNFLSLKILLDKANLSLCYPNVFFFGLFSNVTHLYTIVQIIGEQQIWIIWYSIIHDRPQFTPWPICESRVVYLNAQSAFYTTNWNQKDMVTVETKMTITTSQLFFLVFTAILFSSAHFSAQSSNEDEEDVKKSHFPDSFLFGTSTSSYQALFLFLPLFSYKWASL